MKILRNYPLARLAALFLATNNVAANPLNIELPALPEPISNNAVTTVKHNGQQFLLSFNGLLAGKDYTDVSNKAFMLQLGNSSDKQLGENKWQTLDNVPIAQPVNGLTGRLASIATSIGSKAYVFGGYTVAKDHSEVSVPDVYSFDVTSRTYQLLPPMPVPVDDSVALTYQNRYIYLVSGWHNDGNVNLVQVFDTHTNEWQQASPFPGKPVFGQAAAMSEDKMIVCDGVRVDVHLDKRRSYAAEPACYLGKVSKDSITRIDWRKVKHPTGIARYRMAAVANAEENAAYFIGGSDNPYNYSGIGYNGVPSSPDSKIWRYDFNDNEWSFIESNTATMDHRAAVIVKGTLMTIGGMKKDQVVTGEVIPHYALPSSRSPK